jgi:hypothetical protein
VARIRRKLDRAEWSKLPQNMQELYTEQNGSFFLDADDAEELKNALDRKSLEALEMKKKLADLGDVDAQEFARLKKAEADAQREKDIEKGNWEKIRVEDEKKHKEALDKAAKKEEMLHAQLEESLVDGEITRAIASYPNAKVTPLLLGAKRVVKLMEVAGRQRAVVLDDKGEPRLKPGAKKADDYMTPSDLVAEMRNDKEWAGNFPATNVNNTPGRLHSPVSTPASQEKKALIQGLAQQVAEGADRVQ